MTGLCSVLEVDSTLLCMDNTCSSSSGHPGASRVVASVNTHSFLCFPLVFFPELALLLKIGSHLFFLSSPSFKKKAFETLFLLNVFII